ncbi:LOW QUALITY PROTEIN: putative disease resistance protein At1g50180 [Durio zibethinus]|uniref:LOW QUALITY PROTEIN: putative disease resistance protein At1g50180 n=1 Tax=Durio zibethinus TaxID=66656 RepID=A0A6P5ZMF7_DURZI|nr:LOW QUALITY PROTEIN: putative disease resistance protein At1g50180 [Durio zibethinus]
MDLSAISSVVQTIGGLLTQEVTSLWGVKDQVEDLQRELIWMQSFLKESDARKAADNEVVRTSVAEIRGLAYDAEDIIETFALKVAPQRKYVIKRAVCILKEGWLLCQTKSEIEKITAKITKRKQRLQTYDVKKSGDEGASSSSKERLESRRPYPHIIDDNIVGLDEDIKKLVSVLVDEESRFRVVSIWGMGGLGKTTLAKKIYRHSQVIGHFSRLAWVYVSQQCHKRKVWEDILSSLTSINERGSKQSDEELAEKLSNFMKDHKCLVVLDDIWSIQAWDNLRPAFPERETSSKLLLTSRNKEVASHADSRGYLHELQCLNDEESWELFQKIAFPETDPTDYRVDERKNELGKSMVKHCAGLPLAIIVLGGILATKNTFAEWRMVFNNVKFHLNRGKGQSTEEVLALSYDDLPPHLRPCFLYLSHFPEDYEIHAKRLIQLWVAEGIVSSKQEEGNEGEMIEHVAERYLIELVERCMIQVEERDATFKIKTLHMHDLMRDLCLSKAKQENFLFIMDESFMHSHGPNVLPFIRRVAAHHFFLIKRIKCPHLRSLLIFNEFFPLESLFSSSVPLRILENCDDKWCDNSCFELLPIVEPLVFILYLSKMGGIWTYILNNFKLLRVLNFEGQESPAGCKLPTDIGNLIHLRFLCLRRLVFYSSKLPSSLGNLRCLQTLDLRVENFKFKPIHVPNVIWRMEQLRHLYLPQEFDRKTKLKLGTLRKLQTLVNFSTRSCYVEDLLNMTNLSELEICLPFDIKDFKVDLEMNPRILASKCLRSLSIRSNDFRQGIDPRHLAHLLSSCLNICELSLRVKIGKLPEYHHFSADIAYIHLRKSDLEEDPMPTLEKLPNLRILELQSEAFTGKEMVCSAQCFPKLESLSLTWLSNLEEWKVNKGAMPNLRYLRIAECPSLKKLPDELRFITTLKELKIKSMPKAFKDTLVEGGEDFYKVQHVPSIIVQNWSS